MSQITSSVQVTSNDQTKDHIPDPPVFAKQESMVLKCIVKLLRRKTLLLIIQLALAFIQVAGIAYTTYEKFLKVYEAYEIPLTIIVIDVFCSTWLVITNILSFVIIAKDSMVPDLFTYFYKCSSEKKKYCKSFKRSLNVFHLLNLLLMVVKIYMAMFLFEWNPYRYMLAEDLEYYLFTLIMSLILCLVEKIKDKLSTLNSYLSNIKDDNLKFDKESAASLEASKCVENLRHVLQQHNEFCNKLDRFNQSFKYIYFFIVTNITQHILWNFMLFVVISMKHFEYGEGNVKIHIITMLVIGMILTSGQAALVALVGEHLAEEGEQTTRLCYTLLNKLPAQLQTETDQLIEKQLQLLLDQSKSRNVSLHAGGFFQLNWGILGSIATTVTTYSIVIIQFLFK